MGVSKKEINLYSNQLVKEQGVVLKYAEDLLLQMSDREGREFTKLMAMMKHGLDCKRVDMVLLYAEDQFDKKVKKSMNDKVLKSLIEDGDSFTMFFGELLKSLPFEKKVELSKGILTLDIELLVCYVDLFLKCIFEIDGRKGLSYENFEHTVSRLNSKKGSLQDLIKNLNEVKKNEKV